MSGSRAGVSAARVASRGVATPSVRRVQDVGLARPRDVLNAFGIYLHIPFCASRCWYCDFNAYAGLDGLIDSYCRALITDIQTRASIPDGTAIDTEITSIFFGGGTPSMLTPIQLGSILNAIRDTYDVTADCEISVECNPESVDEEKLTGYLSLGVNRLSIGVQQTDPKVLEQLGRLHTPGAALDAIRLATRLVDNVSADLMFGVPTETDASILGALESVISAGVNHVSCYGLTYESGTPLGALRRAGKIAEVASDDVGRRGELIDDVATKAGLSRYEISNWARDGKACAHNLNYWRFGEYAGFGAGAHSHLATDDPSTKNNSTRSWTFDSPARYIKAVDQGCGVSGSEKVTVEQRAGEIMMLGLRMTEGVSSETFTDLCGYVLEERFAKEIERWITAGVLRATAKGFALTPRGSWIANDVFASFL